MRIGSLQEFQCLTCIHLGQIALPALEPELYSPHSNVFSDFLPRSLEFLHNEDADSRIVPYMLALAAICGRDEFRIYNTDRLGVQATQNSVSSLDLERPSMRRESAFQKLLKSQS